MFVRKSVGCACTQEPKERAGGGREGGARSGVGAAERRASDYATIQVHFRAFHARVTHRPGPRLFVDFLVLKSLGRVQAAVASVQCPVSGRSTRATVLVYTIFKFIVQMNKCKINEQE